MQNPIEHLIKVLSRLPGVGARSARRMALHLLKNRDNLMLPVAEAMLAAARSVQSCEHCGNLDIVSPCHICTDARRDASQICVLEDVSDLWALERGRIYNGHYHILGGTLSAIDGRGPEQLRIGDLLARIKANNVHEIILATNATVEGQMTAYYITERLTGMSVKVTRLAQGIPLGGELDYLDEGTLGAALKQRQSFET